MLGMLVYMFFRLEVQQVRYSLKFGSRAIALEQEIDRIDQTAIEVRRPSRQVPYTLADIAIPFDQLVLHIFRSGGFLA